MTRPDILTPSACFVVERVPGKGYQVTSAKGPKSGDEEWKRYALRNVLDAVGQPAPNGPPEDFRWIGPVPPSAYIGVFVQRLPNGEARYHQAWFDNLPTRCPRWLYIILAVAVGAAVWFAGRNLFVPDQQVGESKPGPSHQGATPDDRTTKLKSVLKLTQKVRDKLKGYLSQEKFKFTDTGPVVTPGRCVKLISDLDTPPPPKESISLDKSEVKDLLDLLEALDEWTDNGKPPPKSGR